MSCCTPCFTVLHHNSYKQRIWVIKQKPQNSKLLHIILYAPNESYEQYNIRLLWTILQDILHVLCFTLCITMQRVSYKWQRGPSLKYHLMYQCYNLNNCCCIIYPESGLEKSVMKIGKVIWHEFVLLGPSNKDTVFYPRAWRGLYKPMLGTPFPSDAIMTGR